MIIFKNGAFHVLTLFLLVILIILWEIGEIQGKEISKRGLMDNINNGIRFAGQMFGISNAGDVANLVAKAFASKDNDKTEYLNTGETETSPIYQNSKQNENLNEEPNSPNTGFMIANMLKLMGLDTAKLGAVALNIIIVIAQMIGSTLIQNPIPKVSDIPDDSVDYESKRQAKISNSNENKKSQPRKLKAGSPFDWILENPSQELTKILDRIRDQKLPEYLINQINEMEYNSGDGDCIKLLICKTQPFFWSMQKQVIDRIDGSITEENENNNENKTDIFYKYLPHIDEFKKHGITCETKYPNCSFYTRTR